MEYIRKKFGKNYKEMCRKLMREILGSQALKNMTSTVRGGYQKILTPIKLAVFSKRTPPYL